MEEVCKCKGCKTLSNWITYKDRLECSNCSRVVKFSDDIMAPSLVNLTNDNF